MMKCNRKIKTAVKRPAFFHDRCWLCGGVFKLVMNDALTVDPTSQGNFEDYRYNLLECHTCGLAIHVRDPS